MQKMLCALAAMLLASCSSDWSAGLADPRIAPSTSQLGEQTPPGHPLAASAPLRSRSFANAPDRGSLVDYGKNPVVRRSGAYTWHAAELSEDHALKSTITGDLSFTAPDGTAISLKYERHVEHPDGNWSWIGRNADAPGQDAVVTFGPEAVFGSIPQGRDLPPLRLTMADGAGWVVSADPQQLGQIRNAATHPARPDYLVPPKLATSGAAAPGGMSMASAQTQSATASATTTVDVLVGYTNGLASARGGSSAAVTRVHNLVDITNQAYANSQVDARLRLVHSMQVSYPDATDNGTALEELTGFKAPSTRTTPAPAFSELRAARDRYGADLVVLLRQFNDPENDGCGIAWLIGGGRTSIEQRDEFFGYSVVSDGQDRGSDGKTYFCREETFAHEVGHNMGSQHDRGTADGEGGLHYGVFDYSFGQKTDSVAGNFYTVMAYGDSGQTPYRVFSNPSITFCGGRACGVPDQADNARSLRQVIPIVATFRTTVVADEVALIPKGDVDASGTTDLMWFKPGALDIWFMRGNSIEDRFEYLLEMNLLPYAEGAYNYTTGRDIAWRDDSGTLILWLGGPTYTRSYYEYKMSLGWRLQASGDRNGDGVSDLYWRSAVDGRLMYWELDGTFGLRSSYKAFAQSPDADLLMVGDFNGDGLGDLFFRTRATGATEIWFASGDGYMVAPRGSMSKYWRPVGAADYDGDGDDDLVWRSAIDHRVLVWIMQDGLRQDLAVFSSDSDRQLLSVAYLDANRRLDLVWRRADGTVSAWLNTGGGFEHRYIGNRDTSWSLFVGGR